MAPQNHPTILALEELRGRWSEDSGKIWNDKRFTQEHRTKALGQLKDEYRVRAVDLAKPAIEEARKQHAAALKRYQEASQAVTWDFARLAYMEREISARLATAKEGIWGQSALEMAQQLRTGYQQAGDTHALRALRAAFTAHVPALRQQEGIRLLVGDFLRELRADEAAEVPEAARKAEAEAKQAQTVESDIALELKRVEREVDPSDSMQAFHEHRDHWLTDINPPPTPAQRGGGVVFAEPL